MTDDRLFTTNLHPGVGAVERRDWDRLFPDDAEGWSYYAACEEAPPPGFRFHALTVEHRGTVVAAAPVFHVTYRLDTPLQGAWRPFGDWLSRTVPKLVSLPVMGLGSPLADRCHIGFDPGLKDAERVHAAKALLDGLDAYAGADGVPLLAIKDLAGQEAAIMHEPLLAEGYSRIAGLPVAVLELPFKSDQDYIASLSANNRSTLRRKLKSAGDVRVELVRSIAGLEDKIFALYESTRANSRFDYGDFEQLSPEYFKLTMQGLGERGACILCWVGDELLAFKLLFIEKHRVIDKFFGMRYPAGRQHNLFFLSWMRAIQFCIEHGITTYQSGQTAYEQKVRLGSRLDNLWVYFRHRGRMSNRIFKTFAPLVAFDRMDPELIQIRKRTARNAGRRSTTYQ
jgi:hypothetical protein